MSKKNVQIRVISSIMSWAKIFTVNVTITLSLIGLLLLFPPIMHRVYVLLKPESITEDARGGRELYNDYEWSNQHFAEFRQLRTAYYDYIIWRRNDFSGSTINIKDGVRHTVYSPDSLDSSKEFWFFGGSTTWGTGVTDELTYPSIFAEQNRLKVKNYGESGYISRQSLSYLSNIIVSDLNYKSLENIHVVFYDGVNDVSLRCRADNENIGSSRESQIKAALASEGPYKWSFEKTFSQLSDLIVVVLHRLSSKDKQIENANQSYLCASNPERARYIAETLVNTWQVASDLIKARGGDFTAVLQPVAYIGNPQVDYINLATANDYAQTRQYRVLYPLIREIALERELDFIDLASIYDGCEYCYIDFCHVGPQAHHILAKKLADYLLK